MHLLATLAVITAATVSATQIAYRAESVVALDRLMGRQLHICDFVPPPVTCERSCGPGYVECARPPNCYNPGLGQVCCSNGKYCDAGYVCTDAGCCPEDVPLSRCGATATLSVIPPPANTPPPSSSPASSAASTPSPSSSAPVPSSSASASETVPVPPSSTYPPSTTSESIPTYVPSSTAPGSNSTATFTPPPPVPAAAGRAKVEYLVAAALGAIGVWMSGIF
ncbi:hypothetical protein VTK73DRAFT_7842 [Phialemonium thermophilum]|uniref:Uncharacterized protein n=1 Tax=Phialemonium thermophilum TaxID=223376 RepID=A0ABR3WCC2_9PEZI